VSAEDRASSVTRFSVVFALPALQMHYDLSDLMKDELSFPSQSERLLAGMPLLPKLSSLLLLHFTAVLKGGTQLSEFFSQISF
jgi:hypothetical protein